MKFLVNAANSRSGEEIKHAAVDSLLELMEAVSDVLGIEASKVYVFDESSAKNCLYQGDIPEEAKIFVETYEQSPLSDFNSFRNSFLKNGRPQSCVYECKTKDIVFNIAVKEDEHAFA